MTAVLFVLNAPIGGAAVSACELMHGLRAKGYKPFAVFPPNRYADKRAVIEAAEDVAEVRMPWWNRKYRATWYKRPAHWALGMARSRFRTKSVGALTALMRRWGVGLVHSNTSLTVEGAMAAAALRVPHVWHIREQIGDEALFRWWLPESLLARTFLGMSRQVIANSEGSRAFFVRQGLGESVRVVYNGVDTATFAASNGASLRTAWGVGADDVLIGMVANLTSRMKRHDVFVRAAAEVPNAKFVVVGFDPDQAGGHSAEVAYTRELKALAQQLGLADRLVWAGHQDDVPAVMNAIDVLVHPCERESFGRVAVEAMAAGKPVVAADGGGLVEIVQHEVTGLRVQGNLPFGYTAAMNRLVVDEVERRRMGEAGRARADTRFSLSQTVDDVSDVYRGALS